MNIDNFIKEHKKQYVNYCEAIIHPNGDMEYAIPSHQHKLMMCYGIDQNDIWNQTPKYMKLLDSIPIDSSMVHWMVEDLNVVSVWYDILILPLYYTSSQITSIKKLMKEGCVYNEPDIDVSIEKTLIRMRYAASEETLNGLISRKYKMIEELRGELSI
jgi:hypothetical protein